MENILIIEIVVDTAELSLVVPSCTYNMAIFLAFYNSK